MTAQPRRIGIAGRASALTCPEVILATRECNVKNLRQEEKEKGKEKKRKSSISPHVPLI